MGWGLSLGVLNFLNCNSVYTLLAITTKRWWETISAYWPSNWPFAQTSLASQCPVAPPPDCDWTAASTAKQKRTDALLLSRPPAGHFIFSTFQHGRLLGLGRGETARGISEGAQQAALCP
jgi:hypothetical protein